MSVEEVGPRKFVSVEEPKYQTTLELLFSIPEEENDFRRWVDELPSLSKCAQDISQSSIPELVRLEGGVCNRTRTSDLFSILTVAFPSSYPVICKEIYSQSPPKLRDFLFNRSGMDHPALCTSDLWDTFQILADLYQGDFGVIAREVCTEDGTLLQSLQKKPRGMEEFHRVLREFQVPESFEGFVLL